MKSKEIICSFIRRCKNYEKECHHCKWNASCNFQDYLILETKDGKTIKFLETK